jgi:polyisoprenoid-binding protein YceI
MSWQVDYAHSEVQFSVKHMMISTVRGRFEKFNANVDFNEQEPTRSSVEVQIEAASINTKEAQRDGHLKSPDFLDVANHPYLTFKSKHIEKVGDHRGRVTGDLTIRGISKEVVLDVEYAGQVKSPWGHTSAGFSATTKINRSDWGLNWNQALEAGGWLVGNEVTINIELELIKQPEAELVTA